jgi:putative transposase
MGELTLGLTEYFAFYNSERPHQSLGHETPDTVYRTAIGGGAVIADKFGGLRRKTRSRSKAKPQRKDTNGAAPSSCL